MMMFQLIIVVLLRDRWIPHLRAVYFASIGKKKFYILQLLSVLLMTCGMLVLNTVERIRVYREETPEFGDLNDMAAVMRERTGKDASFLLLCREDEINLALPRKSLHDSYFYEKYIPTTGKGIYEWYMRYLWKKKLEKDPALLPVFEKENPTEYIVTCRDLNAGYLEPVYANRTFRLYRYRNNH